MNKLIQKVQELKATRIDKKGDTVLTPKFEKFVVDLLTVIEMAKELDKVIKARLELEFSKDHKLKQICGDKIKAINILKRTRRIAGDPEEMLKDKELKKFIKVNYGIETKALNSYLKELRKARKTEVLPDGIAETCSCYISYRRLQ